MKTSFVVAGVATLLAAVGAANAAVTVYTNQAAFNAAITAAGVDTFDDLVVGLVPAPTPRVAGPYSYTVDAANDLYGAGTTGGDAWMSTNTATDPMIFNAFTGSISAIGGFFFTSDVFGGYTPGDMSITVTDGDGAHIESILASTTSSFLGFVSDSTISSLSVGSVQPVSGFVWPTANDLTLGQAVPAPGAAALLGLAGLGISRRRR